MVRSKQALVWISHIQYIIAQQLLFVVLDIDKRMIRWTDGVYPKIQRPPHKNPAPDEKSSFELLAWAV